MKHLRCQGLRGLALALLIGFVGGSNAEANGPPINTETAFVVGLEGA